LNYGDYFPLVPTFDFSFSFMDLTVLLWLVAPVVSVVVAAGADDGIDFSIAGLPGSGLVLPVIGAFAVGSVC
jgi:hypothetical protein